MSCFGDRRDERGADLNRRRTELVLGLFQLRVQALVGVGKSLDRIVGAGDDTLKFLPFIDGRLQGLRGADEGCGHVESLSGARDFFPQLLHRLEVTLQLPQV